VFDHIQAGRILEQPAGKDPLPLEIRFGIGPFAHGHLDESTRFRRIFPGRSALTTGKMDHHIAGTAGFAGLQLNVLRQIVPLVQQADRRDPFGQRRTDLLAFRGLRGGCRAAQFLGNFGLFCFGFRRTIGAACQQPPGHQRG